MNRAPDEAIFVARVATSTSLLVGEALSRAGFGRWLFTRSLTLFLVVVRTKHGEEGGSKQVTVYKRLALGGLGIAACMWRERALPSLAQDG